VTAAAKKAYGQHFLADPNILRVAGRLAALGADDIVLEVGPGRGVLTVFLAERVAHLHAVEIDRALAPQLEAALADHENVDLVWGDALRLDLTRLVPAPNKLVANLPYNIATPLVVESLSGLPSIESWCVMVQREVADRFFAEPATKAYGAVSVLLQLAVERTGFHAVSRHVFRPEPGVDSALVAFRRIPLDGDFADIKAVVEAAFSHRRKTLANALQLAGFGDRERAVAALAAIGRESSARAETLSPAEFAVLAEALRP